MVNIARQIGLASDPDEFGAGGSAGGNGGCSMTRPGMVLDSSLGESECEKNGSMRKDRDADGSVFSLFEAETRRRIWWDIYYYDL